jgi:cathepsin L
VEALEANVEIRSDTFPFLSVQPILDQLQHSQGGDACMVFPELKNKGTGLAVNFPYLFGRLNPRPKQAMPYKALYWGYVAGENRLATIPQIKSALLQFGPVYTTLYASTPGFRGNRGQVMAEKGRFTDVNHAVLIVGWDDVRKAWKIKNSWSPRWGDKGFGWVAYNNYLIGTNTAWVVALVNP